MAFATGGVTGPTLDAMGQCESGHPLTAPHITPLHRGTRTAGEVRGRKFATCVACTWAVTI